MNNFSRRTLPAIMAGSALLLGLGNLVIVNELQQQNFNVAIVHMLCGIVVSVMIYFCGMKRLLKRAPYLMGVELLLLLICPVLGTQINGATRWLSISGYRFAPAMLAMPILCLFWAYIKDKSADKVTQKNWIILTVVTLLTSLLILIEPFISMAFFIIALGALMLHLARVNWKALAITITGSVIGFFAILDVMEEGFRSKRDEKIIAIFEYQ